MTSATRRNLLATLGALPLLSSFPGCGSTTVAPLAIALSGWPGYALMFLAQREGWLDQSQVRLVDTLSATEALEGLAAGKVDGAALTLDEMLRARGGGVSLTAVLVFDISAGSDMLVARLGIDRLADLKGRRIGVEQGATGALIFVKALQAGGLSASEVQLVPLRISEQLEAWRHGRVDAVVTYEPVASQLLVDGAHRLFDSRQVPDLIVDVLALRTEVIGRHADALRHLLGAHFRALGHLRRNPQDAAYRMAQRMNLAPDRVLASFKGLVLADLANNHRLLAGGSAPLLASARSLSALMVKEKLLQREDALTDLFTAEYLPQPGSP